jgi:hypothetical protein
MMDGLVSTGKFLSHHNIKNNFFYYKNKSKIFYSHFENVCGKGLWILQVDAIAVLAFCNRFYKIKFGVYQVSKKMNQL